MVQGCHRSVSPCRGTGAGSSQSGVLPISRGIGGNYMKFMLKAQKSKHKTVLKIEAHSISSLETYYFLIKLSF